MSGTLQILESGNFSVFLREIFDLIEERYIRRSVYEELLERVNLYLKETTLAQEVHIDITEDGNLRMMTADDRIDLDLLGLEDGEIVLYDDGSEVADMLSHMEFSVDDGWLVATYNFDQSETAGE